jgi:hypothetical protein
MEPIERVRRIDVRLVLGGVASETVRRIEGFDALKAREGVEGLACRIRVSTAAVHRLDRAAGFGLQKMQQSKPADQGRNRPLRRNAVVHSPDFALARESACARRSGWRFAGTCERVLPHHIVEYHKRYRRIIVDQDELNRASLLR